MNVRHVPIRTCVGCRVEHPKREMVRVIRTPEGHVITDPTGRRAGRGAYICPRQECWKRALRGGALGRALKTAIPEEDLARLRELAATFPTAEQDAPVPTSQ